MVPLGLFPVLAATVKLILIQMNTGECLGIGPIASNVHSRGLLVGKQPFIHSSSRERRSEQCGQGYYLHPNGNHCCILCHKGTYIVQHCPSKNITTTCEPCPEGSFMDWENSAVKCRGCQYCRSSFRQVTLTNCSTTQDTVCGCPSNHYRTSDSPDFFCEPCSACHNGTILKECSTSSDTVCRCHKGFFLQTQKNRCSPCISCQGEECKEECDGMITIPSRSPSNSSVLLPIFGSMVVILTAALLLLAVRWCIKQPVRKKLISAFRIRYPKQQQPSPTDTQLPQHEVQVNNISQEPNQKEVLLPTVAIPVPPDTQRLPDCILPAEGTQIPDSPAVLYAVVDNVPFSQWKEFVRRLGLTDNTIGRIQVEEWNMRDAQYKMLIHWRQQLGQRASVESISSVLNEMELSGCREEIQKAWSRLVLRGHREASECLLLLMAAASHA